MKKIKRHQVVLVKVILEEIFPLCKSKKLDLARKQDFAKSNFSEIDFSRAKKTHLSIRSFY